MRSFLAERLLRPAQAFVQTEASSGIVLLAGALAALAWVNSPWDASYRDLWQTHLGLETGLFSIGFELRDAVNDGLMAIFFFLVALEIKRELLHGELSSPRKAALPVAAAVGGMVVPALVYFAWNGRGDAARGWGIPMATDIAFAMGLLALLGRRVPFTLRVLLLGLAIVDDLGAILVIAVFYTDSLALAPLAWALVLAGGIFAAGRAGVRSGTVYLVLGSLLWVAVFKSGLHATVAGVVLAALTPSRPEHSEKAFEPGALELLLSYRHARDREDTEAMQSILVRFETLVRATESPLERLERMLHPWVSYLVVPVFALANAGVVLDRGLFDAAAHSPATGGIVTGLLIGKPLGIVLAAWLAVRLGIAALPKNVTFVHVIGMGVMAGIGFTVSLFITGLAFSDAALVDEAKAGILAASLIAGTVGFVYLWIAPGEPFAAEPSLEEELRRAAGEPAAAAEV
ncbi:MAG: Na+/H+ antiporter NhaA [Chloroflexi bacterium]|nr:Na+/H+ antiporter NhaA [Chloroflexota bacterium]